MGFTLIELILAIAIAAVITGAITMTIFQVFSGSARTSNHMTAVRQVQNAGYWVSHDTLMAQKEPVIVKNDDDQLESIFLTWTEWNGTVNEVTYTLEGAKLWRDYDGDGQRSLIAQFINPDQTSCVWDGNALTLTVTATVREQTETRIYEVMPRPGS
jgi:prepilin-type N-terminal cleavage/methylation domain-containing protein